MPNLNGYDAARLIRQEPWGRHVTLVATTGWGQDEDRRSTAEAGFDRHLVKPVTTAALREVLRSPRCAQTTTASAARRQKTARIILHLPLSRHRKPSMHSDVLPALPQSG